MGLAERKRIATIKQEHQPKFQADLNAAVGFELPFDIDTASFPENETILGCYDYYFESYGPGLVVTVFKGICQDDMGKDAVKEKIKKIVFRNTAKSPEEPGQLGLHLQDGILVIEESFYGYSDILFGESDLKAKIENLL